MPPLQKLINGIGEHFPSDNMNDIHTILVLLRTVRDVQKKVESKYSKFGLTQGKLLLLIILYQHNKDQALTPSEIAEYAGVTRGTITGLIDGLERDQLLRRGTTSVDRRKITIQLMDKGRELVEEVVPYFIKLTHSIFSEFTTEETNELARLTGKLKNGLEKIEDM